MSYYKWGYEFWNEIYEGEKNSKNERHGLGQVKWSLDVLNEWRFEDWARIQDKEYDFDDKSIIFFLGRYAYVESFSSSERII